MWYQLISYIKFIFRSKNQHGIHSPFVYDLITNCFYDRKKYIDYIELKKIRDELFSNKQIIDISDFGEGSRVFKSPKRTVSDIAKYAGISSKRQKLLYRIVLYFNSENILELGTSLGLATSAMALAKPTAKIQTVEGCRNTANIASKLFTKNNLNNIKLYQTTFDDYFNNINRGSISGTTKKFDLIYIDGNHNEENTIHYFNILLDHIHEHSVIILDDIYWSRTMTKAWGKIIKHPGVIVSIDAFFWGLLFFKPAFKQASKEQQKKHFYIRM